MTQPRFLIIGGSGALGAHLRTALGEQAIATYRERPIPGAVYFDATAMHLGDTVLRDFSRLSHAFLLHGVTDIDRCARDKQRTHAVNVDATCRVIDELMAHGITPVFASSDAVFDGTRGGWTEMDTPRPIITYGRQKLAVEQYLAGKKQDWLVARLSKVVATGTQGDLLKEWLEAFDAGTPIRCATDQIFSPVHVADAVLALIQLAAGAHVGIFNVGGPDSITRMQFVQTLRDAANEQAITNPSIIPCSLRDFAFAEARPLDTSMCTQKLCASLGPVCRDVKTMCTAAAADRYGRARSQCVSTQARP